MIDNNISDKLSICVQLSMKRTSKQRKEWKLTKEEREHERSPYEPTNKRPIDDWTKKRKEKKRKTNNRSNGQTHECSSKTKRANEMTTDQTDDKTTDRPQKRRKEGSPDRTNEGRTERSCEKRNRRLDNGQTVWTNGGTDRRYKWDCFTYQGL